MANTHEVTVHVWNNSDLFTAKQVTRDNRIDLDNDDFGHAALKLQTIGANKGDYFYLSFFPNSGRDSHMMPIRYGNKSQGVATAAPAHRQKAFKNSKMWYNDKQIEGGSCDVTYRLQGLNFLKMKTYIHQISQADAVWTEGTFNCAQAVAECLTQGGAPERPPHGNRFTPNRVAEWCERLVQRYGGVRKRRGQPLEHFGAGAAVVDEDDEGVELFAAGAGNLFDFDTI